VLRAPQRFSSELLSFIVSVFSGWFWFLGTKAFSATIKDQAEEVARKVYTEEFAHRRTIAQDGFFNDKNQFTGVSDSNAKQYSFKWEMKVPVDPKNLATARVEMKDLLAGVAVDATVEDEGKSCVMNLYGAPKTLSDLKLPIPATVVFELFNK
jgi:hypothetical protein